MNPIDALKAQLPDDLRDLTHEDWQPVTDGMSGAGVYFIPRLNAYLKLSHDPLRVDLRPEYERLAWLDGELPVPEVLYFGAFDTRQYLLLSALSGTHADQPGCWADPAQQVAVLAEGLRLIHALDFRRCPFARPLDTMLALAQARLEGVLVDADDFDDERDGWSPQAAFNELLATYPAVEEQVWVHGDYCPPNVLLADGRISGFIDWGRAGIADPYQDLALAEREIADNLGAEWALAFLRAYGLADVDWDRIRFYKLLDEFF